MLKSLIKPYNLYIALWFIYYLQGSLYERGDVISRMVLVIALLVSIYYIFKTNIRFNTPYFLKILNVFLLVLSFYGIIYLIGDREYVTHYRTFVKFDYLKVLYISLFPIYPFYYFSKTKAITDDWIKKIAILILILNIILFYDYRSSFISRSMENGYNAEELTNNIGYNFCALLPLLFLFKKNPFFQCFLLLICVFFIVWAMKRGCIVISALVIIYFLFKSLRIASERKIWGVFLMVLMAIIVGGYYVIDFIENSNYFQSRWTATLEGNSSGRDVIYSRLIDYYMKETTPFTCLFGSGAHYTISIAGNVAHNDWLELLINQGLFGIILYILYFICLRYDISKLKRYSSQDYVIIMNMVFLIMILLTLFSMSYASLNLSISIALGFCLGKLPLPSKKNKFC